MNFMANNHRVYVLPCTFKCVRPDVKYPTAHLESKKHSTFLVFVPFSTYRTIKNLLIFQTSPTRTNLYFGLAVGPAVICG